MSKRNSYNNDAGSIETQRSILANSSTAELDSPDVETADDRVNSYDQSEGKEDDEDEPNMDYTAEDKLLEAEEAESKTEPTAKQLKAAAFRQYCIDYPLMVHEFDTTAVIADASRNARFRERSVKDASVKEMAASIKSEGQMQPGEVMLGLDDKLYVTAGTGRYLAVVLINSTRQPADYVKFNALVRLEEPNDPATPILRNATENMVRLEPTVLDKAIGVQRLLDTGMKQAEISRRLGISKALVSNYVRVAGFPDEVKAMIADGKISARAAVELSIVDPKNVLKEAKKLVEASPDKRVSTSVAEKKRKGKAVVGDGEEGEAETDATPGKKKLKKKQRNAKQLLEFCEAEATTATATKYGDKTLPAKLEAFGKFVAGGTEAAFLKALAAI